MFLKDVKIVNATPHDINLYKDGKLVKIFPPCGQIARMKENKTKVGRLCEVDVYKTTYDGIKDLPESERNTCFIVSMAVANSEEAKNRYDLIYVGDMVRDDDGNIIGCQSFNLGLGLKSLI